MFVIRAVQILCIHLYSDIITVGGQALCTIAQNCLHFLKKKGLDIYRALSLAQFLTGSRKDYSLRFLGFRLGNAEYVHVNTNKAGIQTIVLPPES